MFSKKELQLVYGLAVVLLIVGVISFAAFSAQTPTREPVRMMFQVAAGNVLFDHKPTPRWKVTGCPAETVIIRWPRTNTMMRSPAANATIRKKAMKTFPNAVTRFISNAEIATPVSGKDHSRRTVQVATSGRLPD